MGIVYDFAIPDTINLVPSMSGYFENGAWIEHKVPEEIAVDVKVRVDDSELDKLTSDLAKMADYYRLMSIEQKVHRAGFKQRLWYLITGKL